MKSGTPDFFEIQRRELMKDKFKIKLAYSKSPASFIAFDILYFKDKCCKSLYENVDTNSDGSAGL